MPVREPGELKSIGSPYCIRDFKALNPRYGTMADLQRLVNDAHAIGMKVILDWVANHTSWDHPWITQHPDRYEKDANGNITDVTIDYTEGYIPQMLRYSRDYSTLPR